MLYRVDVKTREEYPMTFGLHLYRILDEKGLTVKDVSAGVGVSLATVYNWLGGNFSNIKLHNLERLRKFLDISYQELLFF